MRFAIALKPDVDEMWHHARQMGLEDAVAISNPREDLPLWDYRTAALVKKRYEDFGLNMSVVEGWLPLDHVKRGTPEREAELEKFLQAIRNLGALDVRVVCYNWMAFFSWFRTSFTTRIRGGALTSSFEGHLVENAPEARTERIGREQLWENLRWFLERAIPVCEKAGVRLAMHPDDPPIPKIMGVPRLMGSIEGFDRLVSLVESEANGICFCQGNFSAMQVDMVAAIRRYADKGLVHFVHFRDVKGEANDFVEMFHDEGQTDMFAAMRAWHDAGYKGVMRPDHAPAMYGDPNINPGYESRGRLFAIGYMKGLLEGVRKTAAR
jgi:mannonate dehydratase